MFSVPNRDRLWSIGRATLAALICIAGSVWSFMAFDRAYPAEEWLIGKLLPIWAYTLLFNVTCVVTGAGALRLLLGRRALPQLEWLLLSAAVGLVLFVLGLFALGFTCSLDAPSALLLPAVLLAGFARGALPLARSLRSPRPSEAPRSTWARAAAFLAVAFGTTCLVFVYLGALDVTSMNFDARWYHYPIAQDYARIGCIVPFPGENHRAYPHLTSMVHTWALLVPGLEPLPTHWMLSLHLEYSIVVWRVVGVAALASRLLDWRRIPGLWSVFFLFPSIFVYDQNIGGSADHFLGFFAAPVVLALARFLRGLQWRFGALLGVLMAGHLLTKYQALYLLCAATLAVMIRFGYLLYRHAQRRKEPVAPRRKRSRRLIYGTAVAMGVAIALTTPHWVKNWAFYNNPLYPYGRSVFQHSDPAPQPGYYREAKRVGPFSPRFSGIERQTWALQGVFTYAFTTRNRDFTDHRPYMGALFSMLLPCAVFVRRRRRLVLTLGVGVTAFLVWMNTGPNDRYLLSFYDVLIASSAALLVKVWELGWIARVALVPLVLLQLVWGGDAMLAYGGKRLRNTIRLIEEGYRGKSLDERLQDHTLQQRITSELPRDAVILGRNYKDLLGFDRMIVSDVRESQFYISYSHVRDANELWRNLNERGITHLLYPHGARTPVRLNGIVLFAELFHHSALNVKRYGGVVVGEMPDRPPPPTVPYFVLTRGLRSYPDGLYRVEQLDVDDRSPRRFTPAPQPVRRFSEEEAADLIAEAHAVTIGTDANVTPEMRRGLEQSFREVERFKQFSVYLRKAAPSGSRG